MNKFVLAKCIGYSYPILLLGFCFTIIPNNDSFFYWLMSKNLQLSYSFGAPLIVYVMKLASMLCGDSVFALNLVGTIIALITAYIITRIVQLLLDKSVAASWLIALLWLTYPFVITRYTIVTVTYDCLENLFDLSVILFAMQYIKTRNSINLYLLGIAAGLLLLSKYSGIIVLFTLLGYFLYNKNLRDTFKHIHIYLAILICLIIFSPVIIWNYTHQWQSFLFQLTYHAWDVQVSESVSNYRHGIMSKVWYYLGSAVLGPLVAYWLILIVLFRRNNGMLKHVVDNKLMFNVLPIIASITFLFWLFCSPFFRINLIYTLNFSSIIIILCGYYMFKYNHIKLIITLLVLSTLLSIKMMVDYSVFPQSPEKYNEYILSKKLYFNSPFIPYIKPK